jgi:hypothetical protein
MQVKQINTPLHTPLVTLLMHNLQAHARATIWTTGKRCGCVAAAPDRPAAQKPSCAVENAGGNSPKHQHCKPVRTRHCSGSAIEVDSSRTLLQRLISVLPHALDTCTTVAMACVGNFTSTDETHNFVTPLLEAAAWSASVIRSSKVLSPSETVLLHLNDKSVLRSRAFRNHPPFPID